MKKLLSIVLFLFLCIGSFAQAKIAADGSLEPTGNFPALKDQHLKGSMRVVADTTERNNIASLFRKNGMLVQTLSPFTLWRLDSSAANIWQPFTTGSTTTSLVWDSITGKPSLLIAGNNLADVSNVATARNNLSVYSKSESDALLAAKLNISDTANMLFNYRMQMNSLQNFKLNISDTGTMLTNYVRSGSLGGYVPTTRTINGYALSSNISLSKTDVGLGNVPNTDATNPANISQSASYRFVTDTEKSTWNAKQNALGYTPENAANKGQANGYADLDANGKVPASRIDFSQTGQTFVVASQSAMLAVSGANVGAMAIRTDQSRTYVLIATPASTLANWVQLLSPDAPVQSVNGQTGNVNLLTTNIGEGTNLYYTDARARAALSAGTGISYNNTTGQISSTITQYTDALARASLSFTAGSGGYNSSTGVITIPTNTNQLTNGALFIAAGDTANMLFNYRTQINSLQSFKLDKADTATMLSNYVRSGTLNGYVPYSGATTNLNLNGKTVSNIGTLLVNKTSSFQGALQVASNSGGIAIDGTNTNFGLAFRNTDASNKLWDISSYLSDLAINEGGVATRMYLKAGGQIGINTITPQRNLDVVGNGRFSDTLSVAAIVRTGGTSSQYLMADGSVSTGGGGGSVDSLVYSTRAWRQKGDDSLGVVKLNISDTANMLFSYRTQMNSLQSFKLDKIDTSTMLSNYARKGQTYSPVTIDSTTISTSGYTLVLGDAGKFFRVKNGSTAITITIPANSSVAFPVGTLIGIEQQGTAQITVSGASGVVIESAGGLTKTGERFAGTYLMKVSGDIWAFVGNRG